MEEPAPKKFVRYRDVPEDYLETRRLRKGAGWVLLWALGVGAVISGDFFGWNYGLAAGGFWGMAAATLIMAAMYVAMVFSIAELSTALPHAGGFFSFARNALGPFGGFVCGVTDTIEYVLTPAVIVYGIGGYLGALIPGVPPWVWWLLTYALFVGVNIRGVELTLKVGLVVTLVAFGVLVAFYVGALATGSFDADLLFNVEPDPGQDARGLPRGAFGIFAALPFAIWFYLAIEQLPLAAEESHDVVRDMPRALLLGIVTLLGLSVLTLVFNSGVGGGAAAIGGSDAPLTDGFRAILGEGVASSVLTILALTGLVASFHTIVYAYGRVLFALSRAGYVPRWISRTNRHHTPHVALLVGGAVGIGCTFLLWAFEEGAVGAALLNMAVFGAVISYFLVMVSFVVLRVRRPDLPRPYRSPLGIPGAVLAGALSLVALVACFADPAYQPAVRGVAIFLALSIVYFLLYARFRLVARAPEEEAALIARAEDELSGG